LSSSPGGYYLLRLPFDTDLHYSTYYSTTVARFAAASVNRQQDQYT